MQSNSDLNVTRSTETSTSWDGLLFSPAIRKCNKDDLLLLIKLARDFHQYSIWKDSEFDEPAVLNMAHTLLQVGGVFTNETGFIAGMLTPLHFSPKTLIATELAWWAPQGGGAELREAFEAWAKEAGAVMVQCSALADDSFSKVDQNFKLNGYKLTEISYVKRL